jgi:hypothetical protein
LQRQETGEGVLRSKLKRAGAAAKTLQALAGISPIGEMEQVGTQKGEIQDTPARYNCVPVTPALPNVAEVN